MKTILPIAGGKGGVGKTMFTANLGIALAQAGKTCILVDLDLGSSNLHTCLGIKNRHPGIGNYIYKQEDSLESLVLPTDTPQLYFVPGDSLLPGTANLPYFTKKKLIREIGQLVADYILLDLGAGSSYNVIDFFLISNTGLIVTTPETTAILSSYSFLKGAVYRLLYRTFPAKSEERDIIQEFISRPLEGSPQSFTHLVNLLSEHSADSGLKAEEQLQHFFPRVILNIGTSSKDFSVGAKLREISRKNLSIPMEFIGFLPHDPGVSKSIITRVPYIIDNPDSKFSQGVQLVARKLTAGTFSTPPQLFDDDQDIQELQAQMEGPMKNGQAADPSKGAGSGSADAHETGSEDDR